MRIGLAGIDSSHADDFVRHFNSERRHHDVAVTAFWGGDDARAAELVASSPERRASVTLALRPLDPSGSSVFGVGVTSPQLTCDKPIPLGNDYMAPVTDRIAAMLRSGNGMERETLLAPIRLMAEIEARLR